MGNRRTEKQIKRKYETILFDLDGTLLDTNELILTSFLHTLRTFLPEKTFTREDIIPHMGKTLYDMMNLFDEQRAEEMVEFYREHNVSMHDEMVTAFPDVPEVIKDLYQQGYKLGIVTTKQRNTVEMGLKLCGLKEYMSSVVTIEDVERPKPHPEPVLKAMAELKADHETTLMVGDSPFDIQAAQQAGIASAGVAWSLKGEDVLRSFSPTYMLRTMRDLYHIVGGTDA